ALVRQFLHRRILKISHPEPKHTQEYSRFGLPFNQTNQVTLVGDTHVEIAIGSKNDSVRPFRNEILAGNVVSELNAFGAICGATGSEIFQYRQNMLLLVTAGGRKYQ